MLTDARKAEIEALLSSLGNESEVAFATHLLQAKQHASGPTIEEKVALNKAIIDSFNTGPGDVPDGKAGYSAAVDGIYQMSKGEGMPPLSSKVIREFGDPNGLYTFFHVQYEFFGPKAGFDICRWEDGKIVEHWDNLAPIVTETKNGNTMFDGTIASDKSQMWKTEINKGIVKDFTFNCLAAGRVDLVDKYLADDLIQHEPKLANGKAAVQEILEDFKSKGVTYLQTVAPLLVGEADFVITAGEQHADPTDTSSPIVAHWDMYRLADNLIVEHWAITEELLPKEKQAHRNGKW